MSKQLTPEERAAFDEVEEKGIVKVPARNKIDEYGEKTGWSGGNRSRLLHFKSLVYKDLISFAIDFEDLDYLFISRKNTGKRY